MFITSIREIDSVFYFRCVALKRFNILLSKRNIMEWSIVQNNCIEKEEFEVSTVEQA